MSEKALTLISATPSAYARMNCIALSLKKIPFEVYNEIPSHSTTITPRHNPLEQLPILLFPDDRPPIYQSAHIQNYIVEKYADRGPSLLPGGINDNLLAKQIVALSVGSLDALVLFGWETRRKQEQQNEKWKNRQIRKVSGAVKAFNAYVEAAAGKPHVLGEELTIADIGIICALEAYKFTQVQANWEKTYPGLAKYYAGLDKLRIFQETKPVMFNMNSDEVV
jgi:glutathione S-transferase